MRLLLPIDSGMMCSTLREPDESCLQKMQRIVNEEPNAKLTGGTCEARDVPVERPVRLVASEQNH